MIISFIVNGETTPISVDRHAPLFHGMRAALDASNNTARPLEDWELRDDSGRLLDRVTSAAENQVAEGAHVFITLRLGAGGHSHIVDGVLRGDLHKKFAHEAT
jgi:hypothetical protein